MFCSPKKWAEAHFDINNVIGFIINIFKFSTYYYLLKCLFYQLFPTKKSHLVLDLFQSVHRQLIFHIGLFNPSISLIPLGLKSKFFVLSFLHVYSFPHHYQISLHILKVVLILRWHKLIV